MDQNVFEDRRMEGADGPVTLVAVASVLVSIGLVAIGNGLMFAYIPVRLDGEGFAPTWAGTPATRHSTKCAPRRACRLIRSMARSISGS